MAKWLSYLGGHSRVGSSVGYTGLGPTKRVLSGGTGMGGAATYTPDDPWGLMSREEALKENRKKRQKPQGRKTPQGKPKNAHRT